MIILKEKRKIKNRGYITKLGFFFPTARLKQSSEVPCHSTSGVPVGKRSQGACPLHG